MKKLKMDLNGIGELLSKEQMKMVTGGDGYVADYISCTYYIWTGENSGGTIYQGHWDTNIGSERTCIPFCDSRVPQNTYLQNCQLGNLTES